MVRKSSLLSLDILHKKARESVTYLKARHLLPFFYRSLSDKERSVRKVSLPCDSVVWSALHPELWAVGSAYTH